MGKYKDKITDRRFSDKDDLEEEYTEFEQEGLSDSQVHELYFKWLCTPLLEGSKEEYWHLLRELHNTPFRWSVPNDDNRGSDGLKLRDEFVENQDLGIYEWAILMQRPCTVLEMIIGVAIRVEDVMDDGTGFVHWFWELIKNLDLTRYNDREYWHQGASVYVRQIVNNLLSRNYQRNGDGGLFPMKSDRIDQRKIEIWYQMNAYLQERYNFLF